MQIVCGRCNNEETNGKMGLALLMIVLMIDMVLVKDKMISNKI